MYYTTRLVHRGKDSRSCIGPLSWGVVLGLFICTVPSIIPESKERLIDPEFVNTVDYRDPIRDMYPFILKLHQIYGPSLLFTPKCKTKTVNDVTLEVE